MRSGRERPEKPGAQADGVKAADRRFNEVRA